MENKKSFALSTEYAQGRWSDPYDFCDICEAGPGVPCRDLRYHRDSSFFTDAPHRGRPLR